MFHLSQSLQYTETTRSGGCCATTDPKKTPSPKTSHTGGSFWFHSSLVNSAKLAESCTWNWYNDDIYQLKCFHHAYELRWDSFIDQTHYPGWDFGDNKADFISNPQSLAVLSYHTRVRISVCEIQLFSPWHTTQTWILGLKLFEWLIVALFMLICSPLSYGSII